MAQSFQPGRRPSHDPLPLKKIFLFVGVIFLTGFMYLLQHFGSYFMGSIVGQPSKLLDGYACPQSSLAFEVSPIPDLFSYQKGNLEFNRKEMLRMNKKNQGLTSWYSYDKGFNEAAKARMIDIISYEKNPQQWLSRLYTEIKNDGSPHGAVDFVTRWFSPDNHYLPTVYPYSSGFVVDAVEGSSGYGNYVSVCTDVIASNGAKIRLLYNVAHLQSLSVTKGQIISAGGELGKIGSTGNSSTPHAHISIHPDFIWVQNYKEVYNAGYKFYYSTSAVETLEKMIDPVAVLLNPTLAYSVVMDDAKRQAFFSAPSQYIANNGTALVFAGDLPDSSVASLLTQPAPVPVFTSFSLSSSAQKAKLGEWITLSVEALDDKGNRSTDFSEDISVVLSSSTASFNGVQKMSQGLTSFQVTDAVPGDVIVQVSNQGTISKELKISFSDHVKFLEVTAPQKTTVNKAVAVVLRPIGTFGGLVKDQVNVLVNVFPAVQEQGAVAILEGRAEYTFQASSEGVYELSFASDKGVNENIYITVENPVNEIPKNVLEEITDPIESNEIVSDEKDTLPPDNQEVKAVESAKTPVESIVETGAIKKPEAVHSSSDSDIVFLEGNEYRIYDIDASSFIVFNDSSVNSEYPVEMRFTVPEGTDAVSIFTGLNDRNFPSTGELKLTKYVPGQDSVRYYPKYVSENTYKKVVAYSNGSVLRERVFTWSPGSLHVFTDVVDGITEPDIYQAIEVLKEAGVVKGNPDGSYGVDKPINRASVATLLIRAFYADVNLETLQVTSLPFSDVSKNIWYASAIWFASQDSFEGEVKPIIIKGSGGKANPDGNVKIEEFVTMILRLLELPVQESGLWYEAYVTKAIELGLMKEEERALIDMPLERGVVARILVKAIEIAETLVPATLEASPASSLEDISVLNEIPVDEESVPLEESVSTAVQNMSFVFQSSQLYLSWDSSFSGPFQVYRDTVGGAGEIFIGSTAGKSFIDVSAKAGKAYTYRVEADGLPAQNVKMLVQL